MNHPELANQHVREIPGNGSGACTQANSTACLHGTFVAGILSAKRGSVAPAICPNCTLLVRPIFAETKAANGEMPSAMPEELAQAILKCIDAGARVLNVSAALAQPSIKSERALEEALDQAARRGVLVIVAAGNQGTLGSTAITCHPWVIPVVGYDLQGRPMNHSNLWEAQLAGGDWAHPATEYQHRREWQAAEPGGNQRRRAFCDRDDCAAMVGIPNRDSG
jgi:subtilisin family serine protease